MLFFYANKSKQFLCGYNIWTEGVFVTQLSSNAGLSVWGIVWVSKRLLFQGDMFCQSHSALGLAWCSLSRLQRKNTPYTNVLHLFGFLSL